MSYNTGTTSTGGLIWVSASFTGTSGRFVSVGGGTYTSVTVDQNAPMATFTTPSANGTLGAFPDIGVSWCDVDGTLATHTVTIDGTTLPANFTTGTQSGCTSAGTSSWPSYAVSLGTHTLVATVSDAAGNVASNSETFTFSLPVTDFQPTVTPVATSQYFTPTPQTWGFVVRNAGSRSATYQLVASCGPSVAAGGCQIDRTSVTLSPGATQTVNVTFSISTWPASHDTVAVTAMYGDIANRTISASGTTIGMIPTQAVPTVARNGSLGDPFQVAKSAVMDLDWMTVHNPDQIPETYIITFVGAGGYSVPLNGWPSPFTVTVPAGGIAGFDFQIQTPPNDGVIGSVTTTATLTTVSGAALSGAGTLSMITGTGSSGGGSPVITVSNLSATLPPGATLPVQFIVTNAGTASASVTYLLGACANAAVTSCGALSHSSASIAAGRVDTISVSVTTVSAVGSTGVLTLVATSGSTSANGTVTMTTGIVVGPLTLAPVSTLNAGASIARDQCLTIAAGDDAAYECGDLRLVHALPTTTTMNKPRTPTLIYLSAHAHPISLVAADVTFDATSIPSGCQLPMTALVQFDNGASDTKSFVWNGPCGQRATRRIVIPVDAAGHSFTTGVYGYHLQVSVTVNGVAYPAIDPSGLLAVVNRGTSANPFGPGWWLEGLEQLVAVPNDSNHYFWVGGDGSTRLFARQGTTNVFAATQAIDRIDTLEQVSGGFKRHLRNGAYVLFNNAFRHVQTVNAQQHTTQFNWAGAQLNSIVLPVPPGSSAQPTYAFGYTDGLLTSVTAPASPNGVRVTTLVRSGSDLAIADPGAPAVHYTNDASSRIITRTNRLGDATHFDYDPTASVFIHSLLDMGRTNSVADSVGRTFCPAEAATLAWCSVALGDPSSVRTIYDGPRLATDKADITTFSINRFGAPTSIVDALGHQTTLERTNAQWPGAVTAVVQANLHRAEAYYSNRGLVDSTRDINPLGRDPNERAVTKYLWSATYDKVETVTAPMGEVNQIHYYDNGDRQYQQDGRGLESQTIFTYKPSTRQLETIQAPGTTTSQRQQLFYDDLLGNLTQEITPLGTITNYHTDAIGRVDSVASQINDTQERSQKMEFDLRDRLHIQHDIGPAVVTPRGTAVAASLVVTTEYDDENQPLSVDRASVPNLANTSSASVGWTYDAAGRKKTELGGRAARPS